MIMRELFSSSLHPNPTDGREGVHLEPEYHLCTENLSSTPTIHHPTESKYVVMVTGAGLPETDMSCSVGWCGSRAAVCVQSLDTGELVETETGHFDMQEEEEETFPPCGTKIKTLYAHQPHQCHVSRCLLKMENLYLKLILKNFVPQRQVAPSHSQHVSRYDTFTLFTNCVF